MRALIVEDDATNCKVLQKYLEPDFACDTAADGIAALDAYAQAVESGNPYSVIFLDIMMPEMDGHGVLKAIRAEEAKRGFSNDEGTRIIITTALDDFKNVISAFSNGCASYLVKPISKEELRSELERLGLLKTAAA